MVLDLSTVMEEMIMIFLVFPKCIETNLVFRASKDEMDTDKQVSKTFSADICAKKGKEESLRHHSTTKRTVWSWYSTTAECAIFTFNEEPNRQFEDLSFGINVINFLKM